MLVLGLKQSNVLYELVYRSFIKHVYEMIYIISKQMVPKTFKNMNIIENSQSSVKTANICIKVLFDLMLGLTF